MGNFDLKVDGDFPILTITMAAQIITLITDFGYRDGYVGAMKGVMLNIFPKATIVDISHDIAPQDIDSAAFVLNSAYNFFSPGTVHVVVVDPGVGSARRILAAAAGGHLFLAPDNGVLKFVLEKNKPADMYHVNNSKYFLAEVSRTFHGRDIFAPAAAHLAKGIPIAELGPPVRDWKIGRLPRLVEREREIVGEIIYVDRFGNLISNIPGDVLQRSHHTQIVVKIAGAVIDGLVASYFAGKKNQPVALIGSAGYLEIAVNGGNAQKTLGRQIGDEVNVNFAN
jgi:hypothetical protein